MAIGWMIWTIGTAYLFKENRAMALNYYKDDMETADSLFSF